MAELDRAALAELFARARDADVAAVAGTPLFRSGRRLRGECPLCGSGKGKRGGGAFSVDAEARLFKCWACGEGGDVVDLEFLLRGGSLRAAAERLGGEYRPAPPPPLRGPPPPSSARQGRSGAERLALDLWRSAVAGASLHMLKYLSGRGLRVTAGCATYGLRSHASAYWGRLDDGREVRTPAIVGQVRSPGGPTGGVHVTYLAPDGLTKARLDPAKRMWGPQKDSEGRPGGVWLSALDGPGPLVVGEGIESTLSAMQLLGRPCRGVATLSLGALQGGWVADRFGRIDPDAPAADPERPAFVWPGQEEVWIAVDRDMSPIEVKVRGVGGGTRRRRLEAEDRARICAGLATAAWKAAGANVVRVIAPAAGRDFNDELRARLGA